MLRRDRCDLSQLRGSGSLVARPDLVAYLDLLDGHRAALGVHRRAGREAQPADSESLLGVAKQGTEVVGR